MTKKILFGALLACIGFQGFAQQRMPNRVNTYTDETPTGTPGFDKEKLFIGGGIGLGFGSGQFNIGATPEIGYSLNRWLDAGIVFNINYNSSKSDPYGYYNPGNNSITYKSFNYGAGAFAHVYPLPFLFVAVQPEFNWIDYKTTDNTTSPSYTSKLNTSAASLLVGLGYSQRIVGQNIFYLSVMFDCLNAQYSPYRDYNGAALPIVKAGFDFYLHNKRGGRGSNY